MDPKELEERERLAQEEADSLKRAIPRITVLNEPLRHHDGDGALTAESASELDEAGQVGAEPNPNRTRRGAKAQAPAWEGGNRRETDADAAD